MEHFAIKDGSRTFLIVRESSFAIPIPLG